MTIAQIRFIPLELSVLPGKKSFQLPLDYHKTMKLVANYCKSCLFSLEIEVPHINLKFDTYSSENVHWVVIGTPQISVEMSHLLFLLKHFFMKRSNFKEIQKMFM